MIKIRVHHHSCLLINLGSVLSEQWHFCFLCRNIGQGAALPVGRCGASCRQVATKVRADTRRAPGRMRNPPLRWLKLLTESWLPDAACTSAVLLKWPNDLGSDNTRVTHKLSHPHKGRIGK